MQFKNPQNDYIEKSSVPWLWTLLFGGFYYAVKGIWTHFVVGLLLGLFTAGLSWLVYPFFANGIVRRFYLKKGWTEVDENEYSSYDKIKVINENKLESNSYDVIDDISIDSSPYTNNDTSESKNMVVSNLKMNTNSKGIITQSISPEERRKRDQEALEKLNRGESL